MPTFTRGTVTSGPVPLAYLDSGGDGSPVVFLHGAMGRGACWAKVMQPWRHTIAAWPWISAATAAPASRSMRTSARTSSPTSSTP